MLEYIHAVGLNMLIKPQSRYGTPEQARDDFISKQARERRLAHHERFAPLVFSVQLDQIESLEENGLVVVPVTNAIKRGDPILTARNGLPIHNARVCI